MRTEVSFIMRSTSRMRLFDRPESVSCDWRRFAAAHGEQFRPHRVQSVIGAPQDHEQILLRDRPVRRVDQGPPSPDGFLHFGFALFANN